MSTVETSFYVFNMTLSKRLSEDIFTHRSQITFPPPTRLIYFPKKFSIPTYSFRNNCPLIFFKKVSEQTPAS